MEIRSLFYVFIFSIIFVSCDDDTTTPDQNSILLSGLTIGVSAETFSISDQKITDALDAVNPINIIAQVNHTENAASVGLELDSTKVIIFGNPAIGTPIMQKNQLAGLDLPQKMFLFRDASGVVRVVYNNTSYLIARYGLEEIEELNVAGIALENFATTVTDELVDTSAASLNEGEGIITKTSTQSFEETYDALIAAINGNTNLRLVAEVNHTVNAESIDLELNPTRLVIFGNPNLGTPLMQNQQTTGIDLPQKILVWEDDQNEVKVSYNDPAFLRSRHGITENENIFTTITTALDNLSNVATGL
ncbi:DUF302 domain-containing protein [Aquimarina sp. RZ0]|uniref:DUF302 domain-containing protein n=1 Tax=Aquimarina sp. RZ0 TaxID=2607730 RepID=UPI0011F34371|nr:DUF302 domain-containing protein [Aquimarina sp. RZ0]KAA1244574.1 DUF302 domain-containing protein [Aquimarina sp. RZ0]